MQKILAVTTFNRLPFFEKFIGSFFDHTKNAREWTIIIADDGSTDGTKEFIKNLDFNSCIKIFNRRSGISNQTNSIFEKLEGFNDFVCFKADDDMIFSREGWDDLYLEAMGKSGYEHLCFDHKMFNQFGDNKKFVYQNPIVKGPLIARIPSFFVKGCFYTVTKSVLKKVGYMDSNNFFHGLEHVDYSMRCARCGFNDIDNIFDAKGSDEFLNYRFPVCGQDKPSLNRNIYIKNGNSPADTAAKKSKILENRTFVGYNFSMKKMSDEYCVPKFL